MSLQLAQMVAVLSVTAFGLSLAAATVLAQSLSGPWRLAVGAHWTERARTAYAPGFAVLWLLALLPGGLAVVGDFGASALTGQLQTHMVPFWTIGFSAATGVLLVRYQWLCQLWGARVTPKTWSAGCLVAIFALIPHLAILVPLLAALPQTLDWRAAALFGVAVLAVAAFACGGGISVLRWFGVVRPAPESLTDMVAQLAVQMNVSGQVKVFVLEWPQANAVAWGVYRAVGFSRPLLEIMQLDELRAIAAHELAHLTEPKRVRAIRIAHMFAYLPAVMMIEYGGSAGLLAGDLLIVAVFLAYRRFTHSLEQRADQVERQAIADPAPYARSLTKLYEANLMPAVLPGRQTHPHLYDRLLAGGIQPDFARPAPPARTRMAVAVIVTTLAVLLIMFCTVIAIGVLLRITKRL